MLRTALALALSTALFATACGGDTAGSDASHDTTSDATAPDATAPDATSIDATSIDATPADTAASDADTTSIDVEATDVIADADASETGDGTDATDATEATDGQACPSIDHCAEVECSGVSATCARCDDGFDADGVGGCSASAVIDGATGGTAVLETPVGDVSIALEPNALVDELGAPVTGDVHLAVTLDGFDGSYLTDDGQAFSPDVAADVTLTDAGGAALQVAPGKAVVLTLPLPANAGYAEDAAVDVAYYDLDAEAWRAAATGTVVALDGALAARASVTHFTWFGCGPRCAPIANCRNVACGSHTCAQCANGFAKNGQGGCANIDDCASHPCGPGTCVDGVASYTCSCPAAYDGARCEHDVDGCAAAPCAAGVTCTDVPAPGVGRTCGACPAAMKDDHDACTLDTCDGATGVVTHTPIPPTSDGNACTTDACNPATGATTHTPVAVDDGNACTTDSCAPATGQVTHSDVKPDLQCCDPATGFSGRNGGACNDGSLCTTGDICQAGDCVSGTATVCAASDACHVAGTCDPATGACSNPTGHEGGTCQDGDGCTLGDTCQAGVCKPGTPKTCPAVDACHANVCDSASGQCASQVANEGGSCQDGDSCTSGETCHAGACSGGTPTVCTASDACHVAGTCVAGSGCTNPVGNDGGTCSDGNLATYNDKCSAGSCAGTTVTCPANTACTTYAPNGTATCTPTFTTAACNDGNASTYGDTCAQGTCAGTPVTCPTNNVCTTYAPNGTATCTPTFTTAACNDQNASTYNDKCSNGTCGGTTVTCPPDTTCKTYAPNGTATCTVTNTTMTCDDENLSTYGDKCAGGSCGGTAVTCPANTACTTYAPNGTATCTVTHTTSACNDGDASTYNDKCSGGTCGGTPVSCPSDTTCKTWAPNGTATCTATNVSGGCDDQNAATYNDTCSAGSCGGTAVTCPADTACTSYTPNGTATCTATNSTAACNDGNPATSSDTCFQGLCVGTPVTCPADTACTNYAPNGTATCTATHTTAACDDGNPATSGDRCAAGTCGGTPVTCPTDTLCATYAPNGTATCAVTYTSNACDDGNACTQTDVCSQGVCTGFVPKTCLPSDQCHAAGACDGATGLCSNPAKEDGAACDDGAACTTGDSCQGGVCAAGTPVVCAPIDDCHLAGVCDPDSGLCSDLVKDDGEPCDDGNPCTEVDTCYGGACYSGAAVTCPDSRGCNGDPSCATCGIDTCDPTTGQCHLELQPEHYPCDRDGDRCGTSDACDGAGHCAAGPAVVCDQPGPCNLPGTGACSPYTGECEYQYDESKNGVVCGSESPCVSAPVCSYGTCAVITQKCDIDWNDPDQAQCQEAVCDPDSGACSIVPRAGACDDQDPCTIGDTCQAGHCQGYAMDCNLSCQGAECDPVGYTLSLASGRLVLADEVHDAAGAADQMVAGQLSDGVRGDERAGPEWVGFRGRATLLFRFLHDRWFSTLTIGMLVDAGNDVLQPPVVTVEFSDDGQTWYVAPYDYDGLSKRGMIEVSDAWANMPILPDGHRGELKIDLAPRESTWVRVTLAGTTGLTLLDEVTFGAPASHQPVCHAPGECRQAYQGGPAACVFDPSPDYDTPCDDGNGCTIGDFCYSGSCQGNIDYGAPCDDDNLCTDDDACDGYGQCHGTQPIERCNFFALPDDQFKAIVASDQCQSYACNPATGECETTSHEGQPCNPTWSCDQPWEGPCTEDEWCGLPVYGTCHAGMCDRGTVTPWPEANCQYPYALPPDQCHEQPRCIANRGLPHRCFYPQVPDGTTCNDNNSCTTGDACNRDFYPSPVPWIPDSYGDSRCVGTSLPVGTECEPCATDSACVPGGETWNANLTFCSYTQVKQPPVLGPCQVQGENFYCHPDGEFGPIENVADGTPCETPSLCPRSFTFEPFDSDGDGVPDGSQFTYLPDGTCDAGQCVRGEWVNPNPPGDCVDTTCDPETGAVTYLPKSDGTPCDDVAYSFDLGMQGPDLCTEGSVCRSSRCLPYGDTAEQKYCGVSCSSYSVGLPGDYYYQPESCSPEGYAVGAGPIGPFGPGPLLDGIEAEADGSDPAWVAHSGSPTVLTFRMKRQRDFSDVTLGVLESLADGAFAPTEVVVSFSSDGETWVDDKAFAVADGTLASVPDGERGELTLPIHWIHDAAYDVGKKWSEPDYVRFTLTHAGALYLDDVAFGLPPSTAPACKHARGCDPVLGSCTYDNDPDGSSCDDGNPCTTVDLCSAGTCIGSNEIACSALDECHVAGVCDPATGACTNPNADPGTACGAGREGQCRVGGCVDGACAFSDRDNGTLCDDGNPCTGENPLADVGLNPLLVPDGCQAGVCAGGSATACQAVMAGDVGEAEQCIGSYACVPAWDGSGGACVGVAHAAFTTCDDHDANTANDFCSDVTCRGGYSTCVGVPQTELLNAESGGLVAITQRFQYLYDDRFYLRLGWADGTSVNLPPNAVPTGTRVVIAVESDLWDRAGWYTSGGSYFFGIPGPNQPYAIQPPLPPVPDGTERVWWPVSFQPCELELAEEVPMTLRYNAVTDKPGRTGGPTIEDHNTPGFVVNGWDRRDMYVVHYTAGAPEKILPDRIDPTTGILSFRGSKFGLYAVVVEVPPHAPAGPGDPCATDFDCNDHSLATTDTCTDGHCTYAPSTTCAPPPDQCYAAGVIDPATGACTYAKLTGTSCDDGEACTPVDTCQAGVCVGVEKTCVASDQCHVPGVCIHGGDGTCTNPIKANGVSCDDQNACTTADSCQAGNCTGGPPTVCKALDQCHVPGVCEPATGCPNPAKDDYSACDDGDACTSGSVCLSGVCSSGAPVVCPAADNCHIQATCDSRSGCPNVAKPNGTSCDDNNPCTATGSCQAGVCKNLTPTVCGASDSCHTAGVCDTSTGLCSNPVKADGASCDDADVCTRPGQCQAGVCSNLEAVGCGFDPDDPPAGYRYDSGSGACLGQNGALTCFIDAPHGLVTAYARGLLSDGVKGGLLDDGTWVGIPGDTQITLRASNSRALSTLSIGFGTRTFGTIAAREPLSVSVSFSDDGTTFTAPLSFSRAAGTLPFIADGGRGDVVLDLAGTSGRSARYVRIKTTGISGFWTFIDEIALGAPCVSGGCNPQSGACSVVTAPDGQACGGPGDTCRGGVCSDCSGKGMLDCGGVCVAPSSATGSCLTPSSSACASVADCGSFPWLVASCVAGACTYAPKPCDGADIDNCQDGVSQPDGSCKQTGPVLLWDFEDGKTPLVIDDSGNGNTGEWKGGAVTFAQGIGGPGTKSLSLNPLNRALVTRQLNVPKTDFALSAHFKTVAQNGGIFTQALDGSTAGQATDRSLRTYAGKLAFYIQYPSWEPTCMSTTRVDDGVWHHAVLTCQSGVGCSAYLDGVLQCAPHPWNDRSKLAADGPLGVVPAYAKQYLLVGYTNDAGAFDGQIDQVAYYDRPLSAAEVATVRAGIDTPLQGRNRPTCDGVDRTCGASPVNTRCDDGNQCTTTDSCSAGACVSGPTASCPGGPCNTSACNIATGVCDDTWFPEEGSCDDGDASTSDDRCRAHQCSGTPSAAVTEPLGAPAPPAMQEPMNFLKRLARGPSEEWTASEYATSTCTLDKDCDALEYVEDSGVATLISASSNAMSLPRDQNNDNGEIGNLYVDNAENLPPKGSLTIQSSAGLQLITYDGHTRTQLFNVKGGTGQLTAGKPVVYNGTGAMISGSSIGASLPQAQIVVDNAANFTQRGTVRIRTSAGPQVVSYAGKTATTLTGCSGGTGTIAANTAAIQLYKRRWMMVATVTDTPAAQECDFLKDDAKVFLQHKDQVALPFVSGDQVTVTGTAHWDGTWTLTKVPNSTLKYYLDGAVWSGNASDDNRGTVSVVPRGFVGWQRAKTYHCPNGDQCLNADAPCSGGGVCSGTVVPHQFNTSGPVFFYTSPELYKRGGQRSSPDESNILTSVSDFTVNTGVPLTAASRLSIPMPRQKFAAGWNFDPPFVAAGIAPGSQLKSLNAPLQNERGYIFGSLLAGINIFIPGLAKPMPIGAQVSLVVDPADPAFYMAIQPPPGFETTWLSGAFGFSAHGELRHTAAIPLWNGKPLPLGTQFSDAVNADKRERIVNPANIFLNVKKAFQAPQMPVLMYINGTLSMYWGNDAFPINWEALSSPGDSTLFSNSPQRVSGLVEAELGLFFQPKIGAVKIPLSLPLGQAALYFEADPTTSPPRSRMLFRGTTQEVPLGNIPGLEWTSALGVHAEVDGYFENPDTRCGGNCSIDNIGLGLRVDVAAPIPFPGGILPFRGTFQFAKGTAPGAPMDLSLDVRISHATFGLGPGLGVEIGTLATNLQYDGEKFCMGLGTSVPAGTYDVSTSSTQTQSTTCNLRLCMGYKGDFFRGSVIDCDPFCVDDRQCDDPKVCIYGSCDNKRATGLACQEDADCSGGHCYLGLCKECEVGNGTKGNYCQDGTHCDQVGVGGTCPDGSLCMEMAKASNDCDMNPGDAARNDELCDSFGYCQNKVLENGNCWDGTTARSDWCGSPLVCDKTGPASAICHKCYAPGVYNEPLVGDVGGGCAASEDPRDQSDTKFCNTFGKCQDKLGFGQSCFAPGLGVGLDQWCKVPTGKSSGDCGDPFWTCRECGYENTPSGILPDALADPKPACGSGKYCAGASLTCKDKLEIGDSCGNLGGADDRKCKSGACDKVCFDYHSVAYGGSCQTSGKRIPSMCKSGQCLIGDDTCACTANSDCGSGKYCDLLGVCHSKLGTGEGCAGIGDSACIDGHCSVFGDALPGFCYQAGSKAYNASCYANAECTSGQCKAGRCGCGGKASQCASGQFCGGSDASICTNKLAAGQICQQDGRQCLGGQCNKFSPGIYVCGCNGDDGNPADEKCGYADYCTDDNVCRPRFPAGHECTRSGECWRTITGAPSPCVQTYYNCNCDSWGRNCSSCAGAKVCQ